MFKLITDYLEESKQAYFVSPNDTAAVFLVKMGNSTFFCTLELKETVHLISCYSSISIVVPIDRRLAAAELITRINYEIPIGNFEMNFNSGEIRFKTSIDFESIALTNILLTNLTEAALSISDDYFYAIVEVIKSNLPPQEILDTYTIVKDNE